MKMDVCRTALAMPRNGGAVDGGSGAGGAAPDATTGGAGGGSSDDGGCSTSGRGAPAPVGFFALAAVAAGFALGRRRSRV